MGRQHQRRDSSPVAAYGPGQQTESYEIAFMRTPTAAGETGEVWIGGEKTRVPPVQAREVVDPTGCGDAWRGALLFGLEQGWPLERCAALGNRVGALKIACRGGQNHHIDRSIVAS